MFSTKLIFRTKLRRIFLT